MSTNVGTLQAPQAGGSILIAAFLASLVMLTIAVAAISLDQGRQGGTSFAGRHLVNTPSELGAGIVGGAEQTFGSRGDPAAVRQFGSDKLGTNTPSELSGRTIADGLPAEIYDRNQRR